MPVLPFEQLAITALEWAFWVIVIWGIVRIGTTSVNKTGEVLKSRRIQGVNQSKGPNANIRKFGSAYEMVCSMEQGVEMMAEEIKQRCIRDGTDLDKDTGYRTVIDRLDNLKGYREKLETNPIYATLDNFGWPILKNLAIDVERIMKGAFKGG